MTAASDSGQQASAYVPRGVIERSADGYLIRIDQQVAAAPSALWNALTDKASVARWLGELSEPWEEHRPYSLSLGGGPVAGTVLLLQEAEELALTWSDELGMESVVAWNLEPADRGCRLRFTAQSHSSAFLTEGSAGWQTILDALICVAEGRDIPQDPEAWPKLRDAYAEKFAVSKTMGLPVREFGHDGIRFERLVPARRDQVWASLTEPAELLKWYAAAEVDLQVGGSTVFDFGERQATVVYTEILSEELLEYTSSDLVPCESVVRWQLADAPGGTLLTLTHLFLGRCQAGEVLAGWHQSLDLLAVELDERIAHPDEGYLGALAEFYSRMIPADAR